MQSIEFSTCMFEDRMGLRLMVSLSLHLRGMAQFRLNISSKITLGEQGAINRGIVRLGMNALCRP